MFYLLGGTGGDEGEYEKSKSGRRRSSRRREEGVWSVWKERSWISYVERVHLSSRLSPLTIFRKVIHAHNQEITSSKWHNVVQRKLESIDEILPTSCPSPSVSSLSPTPRAGQSFNNILKMNCERYFTYVDTIHMFSTLNRENTIRLKLTECQGRLWQ